MSIVEAQSLTKQDSWFIACLATTDVLRHLPGLRKLALQKYPDVPFGSLGFNVNYERVLGEKLELDVYPIASIIDYPAVHRDDWLAKSIAETTARRIARGDRSAILISIQYVVGRRAHRLFHSPVLSEREQAMLQATGEGNLVHEGDGARLVGCSAGDRTDLECWTDQVDEVILRVRSAPSEEHT